MKIKNKALIIFLRFLAFILYSQASFGAQLEDQNNQQNTVTPETAAYNCCSGPISIKIRNKAARSVNQDNVGEVAYYFLKSQTTFNWKIVKFLSTFTVCTVPSIFVFSINSLPVEGNSSLSAAGIFMNSIFTLLPIMGLSLLVYKLYGLAPIIETQKFTKEYLTETLGDETFERIKHLTLTPRGLGNLKDILREAGRGTDEAFLDHKITILRELCCCYSRPTRT